MKSEESASIPALPRFRYDPLMELGWKGIFPLALANVTVTALIVLLWDIFRRTVWTRIHADIHTEIRRDFSA